MQQRIFGTDGIRDIANTGFLMPELVLKLGKIIGYLLYNNPHIFITHQLPVSFKLPKSHNPTLKRSPVGAHKHQVIIGVDSRLSGAMLENAITAGLTAQGADVIKVGIVSTPALAYLTRVGKVALGIMISASHNHFESNGIKIFSSEGVKIPDKAELLIEKYLLDHDAHSRVIKFTNSREVGIVLNVPQKIDDYITYICNKHNHYLNGMKIVIDCANGATSVLAPEVFKRLGARVIPINCVPTGININGRCGSLYPEVLRRSVLKHHAGIGFSFDGDGDRVLVTDEKGIIRDGDYIMAILGRYYKKHHQLPKNTIVGTVMSNTGLEVSLNEAGIKLIRTPVGDRNVADKMFRNGYIIGGEQSGHIILLNHSVTGDGLITALETLKIMKSEDKPLSQLAECMQKYPQVLVNLKVNPVRGEDNKRYTTSEKHSGTITDASNGVDDTKSLSGYYPNKSSTTIKVVVYLGFGGRQRGLSSLI